MTPGDVAEAIQTAGGPSLDKRVIEIDKHIKAVGKYPIVARLHPKVRAEPTIEVTAK